ncbi:C1 family peptidase [uncultured Mucilaginibacter sp.]|uniref:C1 family peptidase n=1 Tax=uncultured Mucilaginibacter sp. TaxID=797541 RepID=UPI0025DFC3F0|nr:C1 family peptidase [uncultured Mucilaginibacter sp.]
MKHKKGWIKDKPDSRDFKYGAVNQTVNVLPPKVDLRPHCPPVYNQGQYNSCTGNAIGGAFEYEMIKQGITDFTPARLFIYYNERVAEGDITADSGAQIRTGMKIVNTLGVCNETLWPYNGNDLITKPTDDCYQDVLNNVVTQYLSLSNDLAQLKTCLYNGSPFVMGIILHSSFDNGMVAQTGYASVPAPGELVVGGHAVLAVGYNDKEQYFIVRNSWGTDWGDGGYFYLPYDYVANSSLAKDFWSIQVVK